MIEHSSFCFHCINVNKKNGQMYSLIHNLYRKWSSSIKRTNYLVTLYNLLFGRRRKERESLCNTLSFILKKNWRAHVVAVINFNNERKIFQIKKRRNSPLVNLWLTRSFNSSDSFSSIDKSTSLMRKSFSTLEIWFTTINADHYCHADRYRVSNWLKEKAR